MGGVGFCFDSKYGTQNVRLLLITKNVEKNIYCLKSNSQSNNWMQMNADF